MSPSDLFPAITPYDQGYLAVDDTHQIYWEESGAPGGKPVLFLHGGPGSGASPDHRRFFDPEKCRIVIFDQRGAGRSKPLGETKNNTTQHLIADIEELRRRRGIEKWLVFGGSWGSTLALAYAQAHPERVAALVLRGIFLCRQMEIDWFLYGMRWVFPEEWRRLVEPLSEVERGDILSAYHKKLMDPDPTVHLPAARVWSAFEGATSTLLPSASTVDHFSQDSVALGLARMEAHYFINRIFMEEGALLKGVDRIRHIPTFIAQGRYDMVCPIRSADDLTQAWPQARYQVIPDAGHSAMESGTRRALVAATADFVERIDW